MAYADVYNAAVDSAFQGRCLVAMWEVARGLMVESTDTANHAARVAWAQNALRDRLSITPKQVAIQVLRNTTIAGNPGSASDGDILYQMTQVVGDLIAIG